MVSWYCDGLGDYYDDPDDYFCDNTDYYDNHSDYYDDYSDYYDDYSDYYDDHSDYHYDHFCFESQTCSEARRSEWWNQSEFEVSFPFQLDTLAPLKPMWRSTD